MGLPDNILYCVELWSSISRYMIVEDVIKMREISQKFRELFSQESMKKNKFIIDSCKFNDYTYLNDYSSYAIVYTDLGSNIVNDPIKAYKMYINIELYESFHDAKIDINKLKNVEEVYIFAPYEKCYTDYLYSSNLFAFIVQHVKTIYLNNIFKMFDLSVLVNVFNLYLTDCNIFDIPYLPKLSNLNLWYIDKSECPRTDITFNISDLLQLKHLKVCCKAQNFVLPNITTLEKLIVNCGDCDIQNIANMPNLRDIVINNPIEIGNLLDNKCIVELICTKKTSNVTRPVINNTSHIYISDRNAIIDCRQFMSAQTVILANYHSLLYMSELRHVERVYIVIRDNKIKMQEFNGFQNLVLDFGACSGEICWQNIENIKHLIIKNCRTIEYPVMRNIGTITFKFYRYLYSINNVMLKGAHNVDTIYSNAPIILKNCDSVKNIYMDTISCLCGCGNKSIDGNIKWCDRSNRLNLFVYYGEVFNEF